MWAGKKPSLTLGPDRLAPEASKLTPMPRREISVNSRSWPGRKLTPQLERALAGITILARKAGVHDIAEQIDREIASVKNTANAEAMEFHLGNADRKIAECAPSIRNEPRR